MKTLWLGWIFALLTACTDHENIGTVREHVVADTRKLDILVVVDNSASTGGKQAQLAANMPRLVQALQQLRGGLPSVHIGVISTDLGSGEFAACDTNDDGRLLTEPRVAGCQPPSGAFISDEIAADGTRVRNYGGALEETFSCIAQLGYQGCGFEQPLAAMRRALDGSQPANAGFLRDDAFLAVVILTDEDDCSADSQLFDPSGAQFSSFRCTQHGLICDGQSVDQVGSYTMCEPRTDSLVTHPDEFLTFLASIKDPAATFVGVVAGPPTPVVVTGFHDLLELGASCTEAQGAYGAAPATRLAYVTDHLPNHYFQSICDADFSSVLSTLGGQMGKMIISYDRDQRGDLALSYGCTAAPGSTGTSPTALALMAGAALLLGYRARAWARRAPR